MTTFFLTVHMLLNHRSTHPVSMKSIPSLYAVGVQAGGNVDWETLGSEILCGYCGPQSVSTPSDSHQKPYFFSNLTAIFQ